MSRMNQLSTYKTMIFNKDNGKQVFYHKTCIVEYDFDKIKLHSGGWKSVTTKRKMNQASNQFGLGFGVYQKSGDWFVNMPTGETVPFYDGITISRNQSIAV